MSRKARTEVSLEQKVRVVLAVVAGEMTIAEAARRYGVSSVTVSKWRDRFLEGGQARLELAVPGPAGQAGSISERRLKAENEQLKLALAEATVQLRIWRKGAELVDQVPSPTSRP